MLKIERVGLLIVFASLTVIAVIVFLLFQNQRDGQLAEIRSQGVSFNRVLSSIPFDQLVPGGGRQGVAQILRHGTGGEHFAYSSIVNQQGRVISEIAADGVIVPFAQVPAEPSTWLGQRELQLEVDGRRILEFHAPLLKDGVLMGFVRLGYFYPALGLNFKQLPFLATLALPIFLLVPLFYFLLRLEVRPIASANQEIGKMIAGESFRRVEIAATGELGEFMQRFNHFVEAAGDKIATLEQDQARILTSSKLLTYRKNRVEVVLETLPEAVMILDETGTITFANEKVAAMFGVAQEDILNGSPQQWCENPAILNLLSKFEQCGSGHIFTETIRFQSSSATVKNIATKSYPLFSPKDPSVAIGTLIVLRDETKEALARQARVDFVSHLSHELKSPLNVLGMYSESLLSEAGNSKEFRIEAANVIAAEVEQLSSLITGLLNMTQIESGSLSPDRTIVKLRELLTDAFEEARHSAGDRNLEFELQLPNEMNPVHVDKDLIRIAIANLLSNAVKYNRDAGTVRLIAEETEDALQIRVQDTGIGISEEDEARIFDKFYRSERDEVRKLNGHGLGLALTRQIVELHHGTLTVTSELDEGTVFIINLWKETTAVKQAI